MIRLFIAVDIPETIKQRIEGMGRSIPRAHPVPPEQLHITVRFIGDTESSRLLDIEETLERISCQHFQIQIKGVGTFPPRGNPRVLWAGVEQQSGLLHLRREIDQKLALQGIAKEKRKYRPHITLARLKNCPIKRLQHFLAGNSFLQTPNFTINSFSLYSSQLTPKGAIHTSLRTYSLF